MTAEPVSTGTLLRTLMVSSKQGLEGDGWPPLEDLQALIAADRISDVLALHHALGITVLDGRHLEARYGGLSPFVRRIPFRVAQAMEIVRRRREFDVVLTWGERDAVLIGTLMRLLPGRPAHTSILFWVSRWRKGLPLRLVQKGVDRMVIAAPLQYRFALDALRLPRHKVVQVPWGVDTRFWRPLPTDGRGETICSVGLEMRDYETLVAALRPLEIPCHIAAANRTQALDLDVDGLPEHVTAGPKSIVELRELYARSRFVVVPLLESDSDNGITVCLEAMASGKPVICTDTAGQVDVLQDGVNSIRVPPGDVEALRHAIERLWSDSDLCDRLSRAGRRLVEERYGLHVVIPRLAALCREAARERGRGSLLTPRSRGRLGARRRRKSRSGPP